MRARYFHPGLKATARDIPAGYAPHGCGWARHSPHPKDACLVIPTPRCEGAAIGTERDASRQKARMPLKGADGRATPRIRPAKIALLLPSYLPDARTVGNLD